MTRRQGKWKNKKNKEPKDHSWSKANAPYDVVIKENAMFEKYYRQLNIVPTKEEFDEMLTILQRPLPITFRITSYKSFAKEILQILKDKHFKYLDNVTKEDGGELVASCSLERNSLLHNKETNKETDKIYDCLEWYPNELAWKVLLSRQDVRKNIHFEQFKLFLLHQTENGNLNRQEAVSMIPPLLLDIEPHHKILDMCASPGSKTAQLIEFLHADKSNPTPDGFVIANDLDNKRCYMLMHQLKRLESPNFMIINHDASTLPNMRGPDNKNITYDRILADVPCSGDGTFRKNIDVWQKWNFAHSCNLHGIQQRIANRAVELLKPGGIMVYSTCSMNPIENESVVANLLLKFKGKIELVDSKDKLTGLKSMPGLYKWNVMTKTGEIFENVEEVSKSSFTNLFRPHMFPPEESVCKELHLERCMRILPHFQNTGGFFIAVIKKLPLPEKSSEDTIESENQDTTSPTEPPEADEKKQMVCPPAKRLKHVYEENPFKFIDDNEKLLQDWPKIKKFFQISDEFPLSQMMTRNKPGENVRTIYFVSKQIRELVMNNGDRIKFINMGVPLFSKAEIKDPSNVELRVSQEGLDIVQKYFKCRTVYIKLYNDLVKILTQSCPLVTELSDEIQTQIKESSQNQAGSLVFVWKDLSEKNQLELPIMFTAWLGKVSLRPFIRVDSRRFYLTLIGLDPKEVEETCEKIKKEDQINSQKSMVLNPQSKLFKQLDKLENNEKKEENQTDTPPETDIKMQE